MNTRLERVLTGVVVGLSAIVLFSGFQLRDAAGIMRKQRETIEDYHQTIHFWMDIAQSDQDQLGIACRQRNEAMAQTKNAMDVVRRLESVGGEWAKTAQRCIAVLNQCRSAQ